MSHFQSSQELVPGLGQLHMAFTTSLGDLEFVLFESACPKSVSHFVRLGVGCWELGKAHTPASRGRSFFVETFFHRVVPGFLVQGGDPDGDGRGGPGFTVPDELGHSPGHSRPHMLGLANRGPDTAGSQFYITLAALPYLDATHTVFGELTSGGDVLERISYSPANHLDRPHVPVAIESVVFFRTS